MDCEAFQNFYKYLEPIRPHVSSHIAFIVEKRTLNKFHPTHIRASNTRTRHEVQISLILAEAIQGMKQYSFVLE